MINENEGDIILVLLSSKNARSIYFKYFRNSMSKSYLSLDDIFPLKYSPRAL